MLPTVEHGSRTCWEQPTGPPPTPSGASTCRRSQPPSNRSCWEVTARGKKCSSYSLVKNRILRTIGKGKYFFSSGLDKVSQDYKNFGLLGPLSFKLREGSKKLYKFS